MSEFRRVHCIYHPDEHITNFCKQRNCLMPLCPSCIGEHNEYHLDKGIRANYINIFDSLAEVQTLMFGSLVNLEDDKKRNEQVLYSIHSLPGIIHEKIVHTKNLVYNIVDAGFQELEREILLSMERRHEQTGIFSIKAAEKVQADLLVGIGELLQMIEQLKTDKCLSSMIKFYSQTEGEMGVLHGKTTSTLYANEHYHPSVEMNQEALGNLKGVISKFIHVKLVTQTSPEYGTISRVSRIKRPVPNLPLSKTPPKQMRVVPGVSGSKVSPYSKSFIEHQSPSRSRILTQPSAVPPPPMHTNQGEDYDEQFKELSRKVKEMRRENEMLSQALRKF